MADSKEQTVESKRSTLVPSPSDGPPAPKPPEHDVTAAPPGKDKEHEIRKLEAASEADLLNPYKFALQHVHVKPDLAGQPLGMGTKLLAPNVVQVVETKTGGTADQFAVEVGSFLLSVNGRPPKGTDEDFKPNENGIRMTLAHKRPAVLVAQRPDAFLGRYKHKTGCEYAMIRLNMNKVKISALNLVTGRGGQVCVGVTPDRKVISEIGVRVGDVVLLVNDTVVRDRRHCEFLLNSGYSFVDLVIERGSTSAAPELPVLQVKVPDFVAPVMELSFSDDDSTGKSSGSGYGTTQGSGNAPVNVPALGWDDDDDPFGKVKSGDPSSGVPTVPTDVVRIVQLGARDLARKIVGGGGTNVASLRSPSPKSVSTDNGTRVKIDKSIRTTKLKKAGPGSPKGTVKAAYAPKKGIGK